MIARYRVKSIRLASLAKFGCLLGGALAFVPSLLCGVTGLWTVSVARDWLEGLRQVTFGLPAPFPSPSINVVELLGIDRLLAWLRFVDSWSALFTLAVVLGLSMAAGLVLAIVVGLLGLGFNVIASLTGGLEVELDQTGYAQVPGPVEALPSGPTPGLLPGGN